ncbi:Sodium:dicarboxylate symporter family protein [Candidatus Megaera venefica]|jgi:Na+/H+-dicarboxylate symporter|uniref:Sodium:dicarboxylate symporter family protein n=1 Tax=Candidatus Megaera venefica TaxID=2055910 RepID=A0ABU5NDN7_9RICK|nr:cation:dicarboxylase symporter family transporter [Candidatus Megaera venefica]MEA0971272.1 Sodium:dicarboxylate symporter family protein [Candidatus Megaera venefica]
MSILKYLLLFLKQVSVQLAISILLALFLGQKIDVYYVSISYTISFCFIEILILMLPIIVFSFILRALINIKNGSLLLLTIIFLGVTCSNLLALTTAYLFGSLTLPYLNIDHTPDFATKFASSVEVLFNFNLPTLISTEKAMVAGVLLGLLINFLSDNNVVKQMVKVITLSLGDKVSYFLTKIFIPLLPLYVFGFCIKLSYDNALVHLFHQYSRVFLLSMSLVICYIFVLYLIASKGKLKLTFTNLKIMLPAGLTGFSTMSSAATMPVTLKCTEDMTKDKNFADLIIPSTANIHMLGDDLTIIMTALTLLSVFGFVAPNLGSFIPFAFAFSIAKLSCVGIPGASVLVVLPVLQNYLGFTPEMVSILATIYILQDSFGTCANVMGNGAFAMIVRRIFKFIEK